jgi:hypothetical protein
MKAKSDGMAGEKGMSPRAEAAAKTVITVEQQITEAEEARLGAVSTEEWSAANQCIQTFAITDPSGLNAGIVRFIIEGAPEQ